MVTTALLAGTVSYFAVGVTYTTQDQHNQICTVCESDSLKKADNAIRELYVQYNSCLPRFISPSEFTPDNAYYEDVVETLVCANDAINNFALGIADVNGISDSHHILRFGSDAN